MSETESGNETEIDVTNAWQATQDQKAKAKKLRLMAGGSWFVAIATEIAAIVLFLKDTFNSGGLVLLIGLLVVIAVFAMLGSVLWKKSNRHDPATKAEPFKFFVQNQLGAIITVLAFLPLLALIFLDKDMEEQYTQDMNECARQIKAKEPTTACSPAVAEQAQDIVRDSEAVAEATGGQDTVYWIAPKDGKAKSSSKLVFHLCEDVSTLRGKVVNSGSVTEAYAQNAVRLTKQIKMEQRQCGFATD